jgi:ribosomal protein L44E
MNSQEGPMEERDFFNEKDESKPANLYCPFCRQSNEYDIRWRRRTKKNSLPPHANQEDRMRFAKVKSYLVRIDDSVNCKNPRCRKRFEITSLQTVAFL